MCVPERKYNANTNKFLWEDVYLIPATEGLGTCHRKEKFLRVLEN